MVPRKFNIVEFGGFDLAGQYGEALPGIYDKIVDAHWNCVYIMCFGLKFAGFDIAPQYMTPEMFSDHIMLNGIISIDQNDVITVPSIEPPAPPPIEPVILPFATRENGTFYVSEGVDGYNPITVDVGEEPLLPAAYQKVAYISVTGVEYFGITGGLPANCLFEIETSIATAATNEAAFAGSNSSPSLEFYYTSSAKLKTFGSNFYDCVGEISNVTPETKYYQAVLNIYARNIFLIGVYRIGSYPFAGKIYGARAQIWTAMGGRDYLFWLIPCYRRADNEPGFYDAINDTFYVNEGTGSFIVGPNVN